MDALPPLDKEGYLRRLDDWSPDVARILAERDAIELSAEHWEIIDLLRDFYRRHKLAPNNRALAKAVAAVLGAEKGRSIHLMRLFGGTPARTAARIAGLPRPTHCL